MIKFQLIKKMDKKISECDFVIICAPLSEYQRIFSLCNKHLKKKFILLDIFLLELVLTHKTTKK